MITLLIGVCFLVSPAVADETPLQRLIQQIQQFGQPAKAKNNDEDRELPAGARDPVLNRAPREPRLEALLISAHEAITRQDWKSAVERLQAVLESPADAVTVTPQGHGESLRAAAQRALLSAPATVLSNYERQYGGLARQQFDDARRQSSIAGLVQVATRFPATQAGRDAARSIAAWQFDHSHFVLAYRAYREDWERSGAAATDPAWRLQAAYAALRAGESDAQRQWLAGVTDGGARSARLGGGDVDPAQWWKARLATPIGEQTPLTEWRQLGGSASRDGIGAPGGPMLLPAWAVPLTTNASLVALLRTLEADLAASHTVPIPAAAPVIVNGRVAYRDLRGVRVVDLATGRALWDTAEGISPERILHGLPLDNMTDGDAFMLRQQARQLTDEALGEAAEHHPLANWLYRDGTSGQISSDGLRLFALEDLAVLTRNQAGYQWEGEGAQADPFGADWTTNRLSAYDLQTGRLQWTIGGPATGEQQTLPLAGSFFLGVPVADGGELYVIATQGEAVRLHALNPDTGVPQWSQLLAYCDAKIDLDLVRRWIGAPVTVSQGVIICPTASGWLVAVDRLRRQLLWAFRYSPRVQGQDDPDLTTPFLPQSELSEVWTVDAPIVHGSRVIFAPPEGDALWCLSLADGRKLWRRERDGGRYVATVTNAGPVVVSARQVARLAFESGDEAWSVELPPGSTPSGRGAVLGEQLLLPLSDHQAWLIDLADGRVAAKWRMPLDQPPLENLVKIGDRLISLGASGCRMFEERSRTQADILARQACSPHDPAALLQQAELLLLDQQWDAAVALLARAQATNWTESQRQQRWKSLWRAMSEQIRTDPKSGETALTELAALANTDEQHWLVGMRQVDRDLALGQSAAAFELLWGMARQSGPAVVTPPGDPQLTVQREYWLRGRFEDVWTAAAADVRARIDVRMRQMVADALAGPVDGWLAFGRWADFHPEAARVAWARAEAWANAHELGRAEAALSPWMHHRDAAVSVESRVRLARVWQQFGLTADAATIVDGLSVDELQLSLSTRDTVAERIAAWILPQAMQPAVSAADLVQRRRPLFPQRVATSYEAPVQTLAPPEPLPFFQSVRLQINPQEQRLTVQDRATGQWTWLAPLRTAAKSEDNGYSPTAFLGHRVLVLHRGVLQLASPVEKRILWTRPLDKLTPAVDATAAHRPPAMLIDPSGDVSSEYGVRAFGQDFGPLALVNEQAGVIVAGRTLTAFDPHTGRELWRREGLPSYVNVFGSSELVFVYDDAALQIQAYRLFDGRAVSLPQLDDLLDKTLAFRGRDAIALQSGPGFRLFNLSGGETLLRRVDPMTQVERWSVSFPHRTVVGLVSPSAALAVQPPKSKQDRTRALTLIDLDTGQQRALAPLDSELTDSNLYAFTDDDRLYLAEVAGNSGGYHYGDSLATLDITGELTAWDRHTGDRLWSRDVDELHLVYDRLADAPVLMLIARNWEMLGNANFTKLRLLLLDKQSGEVRHESSGPSLFSGFHGVDVTAPDDIVELTSYNLRLRFEPEK